MSAAHERDQDHVVSTRGVGRRVAASRDHMIMGRTTETLDKTAGALLGLAIGDAAGWPSRQHRSQLLPPWTRRLRRELDAFAESSEVTTLPVPFALNQPPGPLRLGPSDDAEWAAWTAGWLLRLGPGVSRDTIHAEWIAAAEGNRLPRGRIAVATAADALSRRIRPPVTGHDNPHHFDDSAAVRAVAIGAAALDVGLAVQRAEWDAEVTNSGDGVAAARAMAAAVATAVGGDDASHVVAKAVAELPGDSRAGRVVGEQLAATAGAECPMDVVAIVDDSLDTVYSYGVAAAETLAVALALTAVMGRSTRQPGELIAAAACLPRLADSAPALTGAIAGAIAGAGALPPEWVRRSRTLVGCCAPELAGQDLLDLAQRLDEIRTDERTTT